jgi:RNA polymerase sigma factor (sigma-70 family)
MESTPVSKEKWALDGPALDAFLTYLDADRDRAGEKYENIRQKLLTFFRCNGCWNPEDLVDDTIDRMIRRLRDVEVQNLMSFIRGIARKVAWEYHQKARQAKETPLDEVGELPQLGGPDPEIESEVDRRLRCLDKCVALLDPDDRELIMQWYIYDKGQKIENKRRLAELRSASPGALRVQAYRARNRLQKLVEKCLAESRTA